jgi:hypothetical protein
VKLAEYSPLTFSIASRTVGVTPCHVNQVNTVNSTYFGLLAEFGEANIPLERVAPKYFGLSYEEARRRAPAKMLPCPAFRLGGQKSPWLISAADLAELIDARREKAAVQAPRWPDAQESAARSVPRAP